MAFKRHGGHPKDRKEQKGEASQYKNINHHFLKKNIAFARFRIGVCHSVANLCSGKSILAFAPEFDQKHTDDIDDKPIDKHQGGSVRYLGIGKGRSIGRNLKVHQLRARSSLGQSENDVKLPQ